MKAELVHDILARKVGQKVSSEERQIRKMERFIRERYNEKDSYLSKEDLVYVSPYL